MQLIPRFVLIGALFVTQMSAAPNLFGQAIGGAYTVPIQSSRWAAGSTSNPFAVQLGIQIAPLGTAPSDATQMLNDNLLGDNVAHAKFLRPDDLRSFGRYGTGQGLFRYDTRYDGSLAPALVEEWDWHSDNTELTLHLRKGVNWSDGVPFTSEDIRFWNDHVKNDENVIIAEPLEYQGERVIVETLDDYTVRLRFKAPVVSLDAKTLPWDLNGVAPAHYYRNLHPSFNSDVEDYGELIDAITGLWYFDVDRPVVQAWKVRSWDEDDGIVADRNPHYWKFDSEGAQLPYVSELRLATSGLFDEARSENLMHSIDVFSNIAQGLVIDPEWADDLDALVIDATVMRQQVEENPDRFSDTHISVLRGEYHFLARIAQAVGDLGGDVQQLPLADQRRLTLLSNSARLRAASDDPKFMRLSVTVHDGDGRPRDLLEVYRFSPFKDEDGTSSPLEYVELSQVTSRLVASYAACYYAKEGGDEIVTNVPLMAVVKEELLVELRHYGFERSRDDGCYR